MNENENTLGMSASSDAWARVAAEASASVVTVWLAPGRFVSGTLVGEDQVLTVDHVLGGDEVTVESAAGRRAGQVIGRDPLGDLALLRVPGLGLQPARPGDLPELGSAVLALARPGGAPMLSAGVLSWRGEWARRGRRGAPGEWLLTDARPFPGFSGGALLNSAGELVGILNAGVSRGDLLAVPAGRALETARTLAERGSVPRGYLGVATRAARVAGGDTGLLVMGVEGGSPAEAAGLLLGDVVLRWDGQALGSGDALLARVAGAAGAQVKLGLLRGGQPLDVNVTVGERKGS